MNQRTLAKMYPIYNDTVVTARVMTDIVEVLEGMAEAALLTSPADYDETRSKRQARSMEVSVTDIDRALNEATNALAVEVGRVVEKLAEDSESWVIHSRIMQCAGELFSSKMTCSYRYPDGPESVIFTAIGEVWDRMLEKYEEFDT